MIAAAELAAVMGVGAVCASILVLAEALRAVYRVEAEWTRKLVHVLMGVTAAAFPWFFADTRSVLVLCAAFAVILGGTLARSGLPSVHGVARRTGGVLWFVLAVAIASMAAVGRRDLYAASMLVLAFADPAAALIGRAYGAHPLRIGREEKTVEGSVAFFVVASACLFFALRATAPDRATESLLRALWIAVFLAGVEAASPAGSDNLTVPLAALALLRATEDAGA